MTLFKAKPLKPGNNGFSSSFIFILFILQPSSPPLISNGLLFVNMVIIIFYLNVNHWSFTFSCVWTFNTHKTCIINQNSIEYKFYLLFCQVRKKEKKGRRWRCKRIIESAKKVNLSFFTTKSKFMDKNPLKIVLINHHVNYNYHQLYNIENWSFT